MTTLLRLFGWLISLAFHGALTLSFVQFEGGSNALEQGSGTDMFVTEQGISVEGVAWLGEAKEVVQAVEAQDMPTTQAQEEIKEVVAEELPEDQVISSANSEPLEALPIKEPVELEEPKPKQVAMLEQIQEIAVEEQQSSSTERKGGDASLRSAYMGTVRKALEPHKVNPRSRRAGLVMLRITIDPSGELVSSEVVSSSGFKILDDAAIKTIKRASPFPPMPEAAGSEPLVFKVPFKYSTKR